MISINPMNFFVNFKQVDGNVLKNNANTTPTLLDDGGCDTFEFSTKKGEAFQDVFNEMQMKVPDRTTTVEEKELAISYIDRMLACDDISDDLKNYWQNKKEVIEMEILNIKNESKAKKGGETVKEVWKEFSSFIDSHFEFNRNLNFEDQFENRMAYYSTYKSFCMRLLACNDVSEEQRAEYNRMMQNADKDVAKWKADFLRKR